MFTNKSDVGYILVSKNGEYGIEKCNETTYVTRNPRSVHVYTKLSKAEREMNRLNSASSCDDLQNIKYPNNNDIDILVNDFEIYEVKTQTTIKKMKEM